MDINTILKEWQRGSKLRNLSFLEINTSTLLDMDSCNREMRKDLNLELNIDDYRRPKTVKVSDDYTYTVPWDPFADQLIRGDGMIGTIFKTYKSYKYV
ncbi:hypothetical protein B9Z55_012340 [Caenorhabditis nigoni]|uniref:F-box associated domain-containing protein n=1 Tax=Caenorhabditis nigoni TaxID=1611254 RepID=A0A2G5TWS7_9PELO|nr:hypothetical protein B9Z55_012340 [Caenorhabditis nigoni]